MLPHWADARTLRTLAVVAIVVLLVLAIIVATIVRKVIVRLLLLVVLLGLALGAWAYRSELGDCAKTCDCHLLRWDVRVPACEERFRGG